MLVASTVRYLLAASWLATLLVACAPAPRPPVTPLQTPVTGYRDAYRTTRGVGEPAAFEAFLAKFPDSPSAPRALMRLGALYLERGDPEAASKTYRRLLTDHRDHPLAVRALLELITLDHREKDFTDLLVYSRLLQPNRLDQAARRQIRHLRIEALLALERPFEATEEALAAWPAATDDEDRAGLRRQLALALQAFSPQLLSELKQRPMPSEVQELLRHLAGDFVFERRTIGCMLPLSGSHGVFGQRALRGVEMALEHFLARPAASVMRIVIEDTRSRADQAETIVRGFAEKRLAAILGPMATAAEAAAEAGQQSIPVIAFTQREDLPFANDWVLRYFITPRNQVEALVRWASEHDGIRRFAVLHPDDKYGNIFTERFAEAVEACGAVLTDTVAYDPGSTDFAEPIGRLAEAGAGTPEGAEALFIPDAPAKAALILPQLAFYDLTGLRLLGVNLWHDRSLIEMADTFAEGVVLPSGFFPPPQDSAAAAFIADFRTAYGQEPGYIEAAAYDATMILLEALDRPEVHSRTRLVSLLKEGRPHAGLTGEAFFDSLGELRQSLSLVAVHGGEFVLLGRLPLRPSTTRIP